MREGVLYLPNINSDALFITLNKTKKHYSPTTMYKDYAINETFFHWQSQSSTSEHSKTGQRYINHKANNHSILLFVREDKENSNQLANPYYFLGQAEYIEHKGSKPMSITWKLKHPMPAHLIRKTSRLVIN
ncbi:putative HKD family nuclease [Sedimentisphaera cyanobacteriorum]|uniref:Putative HKD family nuclease n=2 Tax=Sedimentisphaera cyanobacteriorum TaxID=1940790 RepID=A0A1Q2HP83_9BACT|nr:putative HKD family nuclease [Sedimentisphaera cyanobacteriorum]